MPPPAEGVASRLIAGPMLRAQPDRRLVALVRSGYELAFEEIVRRYAQPLRRYASSIVGARSEDVTQDAFSKALVALRRGGAEIELRPWLYRIVRNTALNDLRDRPPTPEALAEAVAAGGGPAEELERREEIANLVSGLRALPEAQRAAIVMRELEGLSHAEISHALGLSGGAARQAIHRARQALRDGAALLVPMPLLRALVEHADGAAGAGGAVATGAASSAGGIAIGGLGGGAIKAGLATVLVAGAVGAGVAVEQRGANAPATGAAKAAAPTKPDATPGARGGSAQTAAARVPLRERGSHPSDPDNSERNATDDGEARSGGDRSGREGQSQGSDEGPRDSGDRDSSRDRDGGRSGPGPAGEDPSEPSFEAAEGGSDSSGPGGGDSSLESTSDPVVEESSDSGSDGGDSGDGSVSGEGGISGAEISGTDGSP